MPPLADPICSKLLYKRAKIHPVLATKAPETRSFGGLGGGGFLEVLGRFLEVLDGFWRFWMVLGWFFEDDHNESTRPPVSGSLSQVFPRLPHPLFIWMSGSEGSPLVT